MGFEVVAYQGLETGSREVASYVVKQNKVKQFSSKIILNIFKIIVVVS